MPRYGIAGSYGCDATDCSMPGLPVLHCFLVFAQTRPLSQWCHPTIPSCHPLFLLPSIFPSLRAFSNKLALHIKWTKYWSFSFSPSNDYSGLIIPFWIDWFDPLAVQGTPTPEFKSINSSALSSYGPTSHSYLTAGKTKTDLCHKVMSLLCNMLSIFVIAFFPRSNHLLISWLQLLSTVILEPKKIKSATVSTFSPSICHEVMGLVASIFVFWMLSFKPVFFSLLFHTQQEAFKLLFIFCH